VVPALRKHAGCYVNHLDGTTGVRVDISGRDSARPGAAVLARLGIGY
jgi:hypothetical protein